ncbi:SRPBCC family protein [Melioribacter sp. OK-6-Me]|uniref:SRPBCC family protein n=1 Tax=unclassified Melioribacter TaxID=2627329 RepID=UPI003EDB1495
MKIILIILVVIVAVLVVYYFSESNKFNKYISYNYTDNFKIPANKKASVYANAQIKIGSKIDNVWNLLTNIERWVDWQKNVSSAELEGKLKAGTIFKWKAGGISFESEIHTFKPTKYFGWTGRTFGAYAVHNWEFEYENDSTVVTVNESLQGLLPSLFPNYFQRNLERGMKENLIELKEACEKMK